jgi:hypothetical protein
MSPVTNDVGKLCWKFWNTIFLCCRLRPGQSRCIVSSHRFKKSATSAWWVWNDIEYINTLSAHVQFELARTNYSLCGGRGITVYRLLCNFGNMHGVCSHQPITQVEENPNQHWTEKKPQTHTNTTLSYTTCSCYYISSHQFVLYM